MMVHAMDFTYSWSDPDQKVLKRSDGAFIPANDVNADYLQFLESGAVAEPYVAPTVIDGITDLATAKGVAGDSVRATAYSHLQPTDWVVVREVETGVAPSAEITTYRAAVRTASADKVATIESKSKLSTLQTYLRSAEFASWPEAPAA